MDKHLADILQPRAGIIDMSVKKIMLLRMLWLYNCKLR